MDQKTTFAGALAAASKSATHLAAGTPRPPIPDRAAAYRNQDRTAGALAGMEAISAKIGTGDNNSSFCIDLLRGRRWDVDFIYGSEIERARRHGIETPALAKLHAIIKGIERKQIGGINAGT